MTSKVINRIMFFGTLLAVVLQIELMGSDSQFIVNLVFANHPHFNIGRGLDLTHNYGVYQAFAWAIAAIVAFMLAVAFVRADWRLFVGIGTIVGFLGMRFNESLPNSQHTHWWFAPLLCAVGLILLPLHRHKQRQIATA